MNLGGPGLLILVIALGFLALTIVALIRSARTQDWGWFAAILVGWVLGLGWLVAVIYLLTHRSEAATPPN